MGAERGLGNNLGRGQNLAWDLSNMNTIANTKLSFNSVSSRNVYLLMRFWGVRTEGLQILINYLLQQATCSGELQDVFTKGLVLPLWNPVRRVRITYRWGLGSCMLVQLLL